MTPQRPKLFKNRCFFQAFIQTRCIIIVYAESFHHPCKIAENRRKTVKDRCIIMVYTEASKIAGKIVENCRKVVETVAELF